MKTITLDPPKNISDTFLKSINYEDGIEKILPVDTGLSFVVTAKGTRSWRIRYTLANGERKKSVLGKYPALSLKDAKIKALDLLDTLKTQDISLQEAGQATQSYGY